jgi:L-lactate dehydrogenase complex protein LldG
MSRETFLARVRQATQAGRAFRIEPHGEVTATTGYVGGGDNVCATFAAEANAIGGFANVVGSWDEARVAVAGVLSERRLASALVWQHPVLDRLRLGDLLAELSIAELGHDALAKMPRDTRRAMILAADVGITSADYAIAETGTLAMFAQPGHERLASLAPPLHIAIIERAQILPDLFDLFAVLGAQGYNTAAEPNTNGTRLPSNVTLITGPSKTGDIELQLTTGVHGPGEWRIIVIDDQTP